LLILKVIADDGLPGTQGKTRRGLKISPDRCHPDDALVPTDACANQKPILSRQIFQYLAKLCFHALGGQARGLIQQFEEWPSLQCQDAQFRKNLLLSNPHTQGVRRELAVFQLSAPGSTTGLGLIGGRSIVDVPASKSLAYACSTRHPSRSAFASTGSATLQRPRKPLLADYFTGTRLMPRDAHR
jgi:hypothetical protein